MTVVGAWSGRVAATTARVKAKVTGTSTRLQYATDPNFTTGVFTTAVTPSNTIATFDLSGLTPDTQYWYRGEDNGVLDNTKIGRFHTYVTPGTAYTFTFATGACAGGGTLYPGTGALVPTHISNHPVFDQIRLAEPLFFIHMGDLVYYNLGGGQFGVVGGGSLDNYRRQYDDILMCCPRQAEFYRQQQLVHQYDDHDFGPNDSDGSYASKDNAATIWRERMPCYPAESPGTAGDMGTYRKFQVGRVLFIVTDQRYYRATPASAPPRTFLGATQKAWFKNLLSNPPAGTGFIVWVSEQPSNSGGSASWGSYTEERAELYQSIVDNGWVGKFMEIAGDQHQFGFDSGANTAGFPLYTLASLDSTAAGVSTNYDLGTSPGPGHYGLITLHDYGDAFGVEVRGMATG